MIKKKRVSNIILFIILCLGAVLILFPIAWMLSTALKSAQEVALYPPKLLPEKPMFELCHCMDEGAFYKVYG